MSAANAQLRRYGEEENRFVRTNTFGPNASMYHQPQRVRETAEAACESAESAFGAGDPIHIRALVNLALFHWHRRTSASDAAWLARKRWMVLPGRRQNGVPASVGRR